MLSSQTKDTITAQAMRNLQGRLPSPPGLSVQGIINVSAEELNKLIRPVGFHNVKTKHIKAMAHILCDSFAGDIPDTYEALVGLPGVGPKMAHLCLSVAWGRTEGIGVDVHVHRITNRWAWHRSIHHRRYHHHHPTPNIITTTTTAQKNIPTSSHLKKKKKKEEEKKKKTDENINQKQANVVVDNGDDHQSMDIVSTKNPEETRKCLQTWLPTPLWHEINHLLVGFGQTICLPVGRKCHLCAVASTGFCPAMISSASSSSSSSSVAAGAGVAVDAGDGATGTGDGDGDGADAGGAGAGASASLGPTAFVDPGSGSDQVVTEGS